MQRGMKWLILGFVVAIIMPKALYAVCGADTRKTIGSPLKCHELQGDTWYQINVNEMCGTKQGVEQMSLELEEIGKDFKNYDSRVFANEQESLISGQKLENNEFLLFVRNVGKRGSLKAFAIPSADKKTIEKVRLEIIPNRGDSCAQIVPVSDIWKQKIS